MCIREINTNYLDFDRDALYHVAMESMVSKRLQTVIPAAIRRRHNIREGDRLKWIDDGETIRVVPLPADLIEALCGRA